MAVYVTEEELREEIDKLQKSKKLTELVKKYNNLKNLDLSLETEEIDSLQQAIELLKEEGIVENYSKEQFGIMILKIVQKLATRPNFGGYTESWKHDFYSNALEKILAYAINNIDLEMISPRSGERVKVFAYITQIASNAFIEVINKRKEEQNMIMEKLIPFEDFYSHVKKYYNPVYEKIKEDKEDADIKLGYVEDNNGTPFYDSEGTLIGTYRLTQDSETLGNWGPSVYTILKKYRKRTDKIKIVYPEAYKMSMDEYNNINSLGYSFLNVHKDCKEGYVPHFPKRQKKIKVDKFEDWEV